MFCLFVVVVLVGFGFFLCVFLIWEAIRFEKIQQKPKSTHEFAVVAERLKTAFSERLCIVDLDVSEEHVVPVTVTAARTPQKTQLD